MKGVSFVVPVHNGAAWIEDTLAAIGAQSDGRPMEILVVDDRSSDRSPAILKRLAERLPLRIVAGEGRGAAAALNLGVRLARFPVICQVDQDVLVRRGWMRRLTAEFEDPAVAAAQGYFETDDRAGLCARAMNLDLEQRYAAVDDRNSGHVCTGNTAYRADALNAIGLFDETLGYGYDNDVSYRLRAAGYRLTLCRDARSVHRWREGLPGYLVQQYGFGYGRIDLVAKHPARVAGDSVSPAGMMLQPLLTAAAIAGMAVAAIVGAAGGASRSILVAAAALLAVVVLERLAAGFSAAWRFRTMTPLVFPILHVGRNLAWVAAIVVWTVRRLGGRRSTPSHSMRPRREIAP